MKKGRFSEEQMVVILREADRAPVVDVARKHAISAQTIYAWRKRFGTLEAPDIKRLRHLEGENARLKRLVAERDLEIDVMKEIQAKKIVSAPGRREQVAFATCRGLSQRRACVRAAQRLAIELGILVFDGRRRLFTLGALERSQLPVPTI